MPAPHLRTKKSLSEMDSGQVLHVLATDGAARDFRAFAKQTGNQLLEVLETGPVFEFYFRRK